MRRRGCRGAVAVDGAVAVPCGTARRRGLRRLVAGAVGHRVRRAARRLASASPSWPGCRPRSGRSVCDWPLRICLISGVAWASVCWVAGLDLRHLEHVVAELAVDRAERACSAGRRTRPCRAPAPPGPCVTPVSRPPLSWSRCRSSTSWRPPSSSGRARAPPWRRGPGFRCSSARSGCRASPACRTGTCGCCSSVWIAAAVTVVWCLASSFLKIWLTRTRKRMSCSVWPDCVRNVCERGRGRELLLLGRLLNAFWTWASVTLIPSLCGLGLVPVGA